MIIDIHSHIKLDGQQPLFQDMDKNGIDYRIVSCLSEPDTKIANKFVEELVSAHPDRLGGCAVINPKQKDCAEECERFLENPAMKMVEFNSLEHGYYPDVCEGVDKVLKVVAKNQAIVKVFSGIGSRAMPQQWLKHVEKYPQIPFIFLHMGCFDYGYGCVDLAGRYENIYLETSNQYEVQIMKKAVTTAPQDKLLFGSSYPERLTKCSLDVLDMFHLDEGFRKKIFGENAAALLNLNLKHEV